MTSIRTIFHGSFIFFFFSRFFLSSVGLRFYFWFLEHNETSTLLMLLLGCCPLRRGALAFARNVLLFLDDAQILFSTALQCWAHQDRPLFCSRDSVHIILYDDRLVHFFLTAISLSHAHTLTITIRKREVDQSWLRVGFRTCRHERNQGYDGEDVVSATIETTLD
jgi:hypothetical protein